MNQIVPCFMVQGLCFCGDVSIYEEGGRWNGLCSTVEVVGATEEEAYKNLRLALDVLSFKELGNLP